MRLYELTEINRTPVATNRFMNDLEKVMMSVPSAADDLAAFIEFKRTALPNAKFGKKDDRFRNDYLSNFWHWHLVHGKLIVVYQTTATLLKLVTIINHKIIDGVAPRSWANWLDSLTPSDYFPFTIPGEEDVHEITHDEKENIIKLFWEMALNPSDRTYLEDLVNGKWSEDLHDFMVSMVTQPISDFQKWEAILKGFGEEDGLVDAVRKVLAQTK